MSLYEASDMHQSLSLSDATLAALDLPQQPFGALEANSNSFSDETTTEQIADVKQALITGDDLLLILGDEGAGKTVMLKQLGEQSGLRIQCFAVKGSERFSTMNLFAGLLEAFKHSPPEKLQDILDDLIPYLQSMITRNTLSVIVLDDAHKVKESELTQLLSAMLYINSHDETVMRIAMAAPQEFEAQIPDLLPEGADLPYSSLTISGMTPPRATDFIDFRMQEAGLRGTTPFSETEIIDLVERSDGLPGALQIAAADTLNEQYGPVRRDLDSDMVGAATGSGTGSSFIQSRFAKMALGALAVFFIAVGILMSLPGKSNEDAGRYTVSKTEAIDLSDSDSELRLIENTSNSGTDLAGSTASATAKITLNGVESTGQAAEQALSSGAGAAAELESQINPTTDAPSPTANDTSSESKPIVIVAEPESVDAQTESEPTVPQTPAVAAAPVVEAESQENNSTSSGQVGALESSSWILLQDRARYTVQMSASRDKSSVINFLNLHAEALTAPNSIYTFARNGSNWYALLHGLYDSIDAAKLAVEAMPPAALTNQPWIRSVARVQDVLKAQ